MGWLTHRNNIIAISVVTALLLLGIGESLGIGITKEILNLGISLAQVLFIGQAYVAWALWKRYV